MNKRIKKKKAKQQIEKLDLLTLQASQIALALCEVLPKIIESVEQAASQIALAFRNINWSEVIKQYVHDRKYTQNCKAYKGVYKCNYFGCQFNKHGFCEKGDKNG